MTDSFLYLFTPMYQQRPECCVSVAEATCTFSPAPGGSGKQGARELAGGGVCCCRVGPAPTDASFLSPRRSSPESAGHLPPPAPRPVRRCRRGPALPLLNLHVSLGLRGPLELLFTWEF